MNPSFLTDFIEASREFPCLWKVKSNKYRDRNKRDEALNNLLLLTRDTIPTANLSFVKSRIESIKQSFRREFRKVRLKMKSGTAAEDDYKSRFWYYDLISFIADHETLSTSTTTLQEDEEEDEDVQNESHRTKCQKTESLRKTFSPEELSFASHMSLRSSGQVSAASVVKDVTQTTPTRGKKFKTAFKSYSVPKKRQLTGAETLAMYVGAQLTRHQNNIIREQDKERFPSYKKIQAAKKECYPNKDSIIVTETPA
nr:uncharacterized protein LOC111517282 [Leptinotarsa decemlineata]